MARVETRLNSLEKALGKLIEEDVATPSTWYIVNIDGECPRSPESCPLRPGPNSGIVFTLCHEQCPFKVRNS